MNYFIKSQSQVNFIWKVRSLGSIHFIYLVTFFLQCLVKSTKTLSILIIEKFFQVKFLIDFLIGYIYAHQVFGNLTTFSTITLLSKNQLFTKINFKMSKKSRYFWTLISKLKKYQNKPLINCLHKF